MQGCTLSIAILALTLAIKYKYLSLHSTIYLYNGIIVHIHVNRTEMLEDCLSMKLNPSKIVYGILCRNSHESHQNTSLNVANYN